jgi:hypothetical protein
MNTIHTTYDDPTLQGGTAARDRALLGPVMGYGAVTVGFSALGAYVGRNPAALAGSASSSSPSGSSLGSTQPRPNGANSSRSCCSSRSSSASPPLPSSRTTPDADAVWQAAGGTAAFVAALGAYRYAARRDLSSWARVLFWALLALIAFGLVSIFISIPNSNMIYAVAGLVIFGGFTIVDFKPPAPEPRRSRRPDRGIDLPRHLHRVPARRGAVQRPARIDGNAMSDNTETAIIAGGRFRGVEELLRHRDGVISTRVGYSGGVNDHSAYGHYPGHAEAVEIVFGPERITYRDVLEFWEAEPEHQDNLQRYPNGYTCHCPRRGWTLPHRETAACARSEASRGVARTTRGGSIRLTSRWLASRA